MISPQPLVSVIVNNYNYDCYLPEAIDSAINQTYPRTEIIVVDDGSTDKSQQIITSYQDKVIPIFKENGGQASAFNAGFAVSQGEIICLLDSDDVWLPQKVEQVVEAALAYPQAAVIYHRVQNINQIGLPTGKPWPPYKVIKKNIASQVAKTGGWWPFPPSTGLSFTRRFLSQIMPIPATEYRLCADTYLADLAPFFGEVIGIELALSQYRIHNANNWSNSLNKQLRDLQFHELRVKILNQILKKSGINVEVNLAEHLPYQRLKYKTGEEKIPFKLSKLAWKNPWEFRPTSRLKAVYQLWSELPKIWKLNPKD
ncbi:MAG: glycosyltransferase family 2 protein [Kastovskya adunca ATA6-11-RM4]|jgi:glycosyltransferase involved in cell wall biosynthesis|nr:glycosyltransferase family 2 protein [Kastovskya adunca ATA6-11-RM4]